ncbi:hypothetical protein SAMN05444159_0003 [Bradyrhizobium lablabi]|uniref:Uncharacterized protein n=1 Tax=Bradyrhizobium lablabi TaxID=722472 RepID=A0A1M6HH27_9BRAD|nr:hypothetical protein [Bradyrhizobium lablabi]SHJ21444.1 hypothetical protein SAMN05444159_0003 [Bradyrhizobium lablabi]
MLFIVLSGIVGAGAIFFALWPYGACSTFLAAPFRGPRGPVIGPAVGGLAATRHDNLP